MNTRTKSPRSTVTVDTYRDDKLYPRIARAVETLLAKGKVVAPVDLLVQIGLLEQKHLEDWRSDVIFLEGQPDVPESRPQARVKS